MSANLSARPQTVTTDLTRRGIRDSQIREVTSVTPPLLLAARAVLPGVEQHAVVAPDVAAPLPLGQGQADQAAHGVLDRPGQP
ncbi:hypothetical protein ACH427_29605 [Streptomyces sp. NPDC020379]|uniref:hypothetical protein n=1 Tax=Streptomyces sp. NPDC020379 TaxID=3365071 RepID=UPI0037BCC673